MAVNLSKTNHPSYPEMLYEAISKSKNKQGCSRADILNFITKKYQLESRKQANEHLSKSISRALKTGRLIQITGTGLNGRFLINKINGSSSDTDVTATPNNSPTKKSNSSSPVQNLAKIKKQKTMKSVKKKSTTKTLKTIKGSTSKKNNKKTNGKNSKPVKQAKRTKNVKKKQMKA